MKKYITFYDTQKKSFVVAQRQIVYNQWNYAVISEGVINKDQVFDTKEDAIKSLKRSNYIEIK